MENDARGMENDARGMENDARRLENERKDINRIDFSLTKGWDCPELNKELSEIIIVEYQNDGD